MENFKQKTLNDVLVITVNLTRATVNESAELKNLLTTKITMQQTKIVADLSQCSSLDSTFIGVLVVSHKELITRGGELKLVEPLEPAKELIHLTGVVKIINTYPTIEKAVKSFDSGIAPKEKEKSDFEDKPGKKVDWDFG
ncbi:MAG: hypothetical protein DRQ01_03235 [Ignavibacteriae bacterium]|nr:MAG: hypothetical protein DRQ01_03235 [Ignavibacteriota bacterium]